MESSLLAIKMHTDCRFVSLPHWLHISNPYFYLCVIRSMDQTGNRGKAQLIPVTDLHPSAVFVRFFNASVRWITGLVVWSFALNDWSSGTDAGVLD